ncbi:putative DNA-binding domain-containing protein [Xanthomonas sp. CFBP 8703]|uniref:DNA-binding domain-containing protein n=1 Tax=Xanthomonas bonasiae TaxID=2810351 RepID=A0ABS3B2E4_9XANT|nr:DNA-binding domain-containing protein [Xanthomonas bonasiae]MBN6102747.1 putative DNA-binding domain-containing protein [Xanthomonas bonasiae]
MSLLELQRRFSGWLRDPAADADAWLDARQRPGLRVYRHAYSAQLGDALRDTYAKTLAWLGEAAFDAAAACYVASHPPSAWSLGAYGDRFGAHLAVCHPERPEIEDLAWLDLALRRAFDGTDAAPVTLASLAGVDWEQARLRFVPTLRRRGMRSNAAMIWRALSEGTPPPAAVRLPETMVIRVWRKGLSPYFQSMSPLEARMLRDALAGVPFGVLCRHAPGDDPALIGQVLEQWLRDELLEAVAPA